MKKTLLLTICAVFLLSGCVSTENIVENPDESPAFKMFGPGMMPTYEEGDILFVEDATKLNRGDVVVFKPYAEKEDRTVKRVIGIPGDTLEIVDGKVKITNSENPNGYFLDEPYLSEAPHEKTFPSAPNGPSVFEIPEGKYFMLGDNRSASTDSRTCFKDPFMGGCGDTGDYYITIEDVLGVVTND